MAAKTKFEPSGQVSPLRRMWHFVRRWLIRALLAVVVFYTIILVAYKWIDPPTTIYMQQEKARLGSVRYEWVDLEHVAPVMLRAVVAAEDANFCLHWGIDSGAVRQALAEGAVRGGSTISQQTVKNTLLWHGRSWLRKALEAILTPAAEFVWGKERMLEIYLNVIEFDTGVFGIEAAAQHHFGSPAAMLNRVEAGRLAAVLPDPQDYSAIRPSPRLQKRAASIIAGSDMIRRDGRAKCFQD